MLGFLAFLGIAYTPRTSAAASATRKIGPPEEASAQHCCHATPIHAPLPQTVHEPRSVRMSIGATDKLLSILIQGRGYSAERREEVQEPSENVFKERCHSNDWRHFQARNALGEGVRIMPLGLAGSPPRTQPQVSIKAPASSGFPGRPGSVAVLCVGTGGFGSDSHILSRPGHRRRLPARRRSSGSALGEA